MKGKGCAEIGKVTKEQKLLVHGLNGKVVVDASLADASAQLEENPKPRGGATMNLEDIKVCVLRVGGTNCDAETQRAFQELGVQAETVHVNELIKRRNLLDY